MLQAAVKVAANQLQRALHLQQRFDLFLVPSTGAARKAREERPSVRWPAATVAGGRAGLCAHLFEPPSDSRAGHRVTKPVAVKEHPRLPQQSRTSDM